jgi:germacradienol/geosmin synthase
MPPFKLPDFYMPYPARLNPHLEGARSHSKAWAHEMGMLEPQDGVVVWTERDLDQHDYALLCSYTHPDASPSKLDLVTDWYVWVFYFDDHFLEIYKRTKDMKGAKEYLARLGAFMPVTFPAEGTSPTPENPVERGLQNLWARTAPNAQLDWRQRFFESTKNLLDESLWELANIQEQRVANPIEYIELRRRVDNHLQHRIPDPVDYIEMRRFTLGADVITGLSRLSLGDVMSPELVNTRTMMQLEGSVADIMGLMNDIFSYQKEVEFEGELNNFVVVVRRFLECEQARALEITAELLVSRVHQF